MALHAQDLGERTHARAADADEVEWALEERRARVSIMRLPAPSAQEGRRRGPPHPAAKCARSLFDASEGVSGCGHEDRNHRAQRVEFRLGDHERGARATIAFAFQV